jgi:hypothetical protein
MIESDCSASPEQQEGGCLSLDYRDATILNQCVYLLLLPDRDDPDAAAYAAQGRWEEKV